MGRAASKDAVGVPPSGPGGARSVAQGKDHADRPISFSPETLDFGVDQPIVLNQPSVTEVTITNKTANKLKYRFEVAPAGKECSVEFNPAMGAIPPGKDKKVKISLIMHQSINANFKSQVVIDTTPYFIAVRIRCATGVFGCDPTSLTCVKDGPFEVPEALVLMKQALISQDALRSEGIFRLAGEVPIIARIKAELNNKTFTTSDDANAVATLIKVWFRELPVPLLQSVPPETIFNASDTAACVKAYEALKLPEKELLGWLIELLIATAKHQQINKMTPQNLAICVAPNLYDVSSSDPMEGLVLSQKCVLFLTNLLNWRIEHPPSPLSEPTVSLASSSSSTSSLPIAAVTATDVTTSDATTAAAVAPSEGSHMPEPSPEPQSEPQEQSNDASRPAQAESPIGSDVKEKHRHGSKGAQAHKQHKRASEKSPNTGRRHRPTGSASSGSVTVAVTGSGTHSPRRASDATDADLQPLAAPPAAPAGLQEVAPEHLADDAAVDSPAVPPVDTMINPPLLPPPTPLLEELSDAL